MNETKTLEIKEKITGSFLKTVSAFANYSGGEILFGVSDDGTVVGLSNLDQAKLDIENMINDSIHPRPDYYFAEHPQDHTISLFVEEGVEKPYFYKGKAYQRNDTATIEVDALGLRRLALAGSNRNYEDLKSEDQKLKFTILEEKLKETIHIQSLTIDIMKTLDLYDEKNGYNIAAALLADRNNFPGIDMVKFGSNLNVMKERVTSKGVSVLKQYDDAVGVYRRYYVEQVIEGIQRKERELIPEKAFREAVANALVHRSWDVNADIHIAMYDDRIEIISVGGLPEGLDKDYYLKGGISILRNPTLASVFYRMNYIEAFGTGIQRILMSYEGKSQRPVFDTTETAVRVILPVLSEGLEMTDDERKVYDALKGRNILSSTDIAERTGMTKAKVIRLLNSLIERNLIVKTGHARTTRYHI